LDPAYAQAYVEQLITRGGRSDGRGTTRQDFPVNQAVHIPREWELPGEDAIMTRYGERLIIVPPPKSSIERLSALLESWEDDLSEDEALPEIEDLPLEPFGL
jgi:antitoxin VapB